MKKILSLILTFCVGIVFSFANPSLDGRAVVAENGVFPPGLFAKTVGYLPGDTISVTNPANAQNIDILVIGSLDPSEGVAIMLSPEAADCLQIKKDSNMVVKLTKRSGELDENVSGTCVLSQSPVAVQKTEESVSQPEFNSADSENVTDEEILDVAENELVRDEQIEQPIADVMPSDATEDVVSEENIIEDLVPEEEIAEEQIADDQIIAESEEIISVAESDDEILQEYSQPEEFVESEEIPEEFAESDDVPEEILVEQFPVDELDEFDEIAESDGTETEVETEEIAAVQDTAEPEEVISEEEIEEIPEEVLPQEEIVQEEPLEDEIPAEQRSVVADNYIPPEEESVTEDELPPEYQEEKPLPVVKDDFVPPEQESVAEDELPPEEQLAEETETAEEIPEELALEEDTQTEEEVAYVPESESVEEEMLPPEEVLQDSVIAETTEIAETEAVSDSEDFEAIVLVPSEENPPAVSEKVAVESSENKVSESVKVEQDIVAFYEEPVKPEEQAKTEQKTKTSVSQSYKVIESLPKGSYFVQLAAYKNQENVQNILEKYGSKYPISVQESNGKKIVLVGPLSVDEYGTVLQRFKAFGFKDAFLRKGK
ncbi:MAG: SPOR domain-containing protein [Spirochaetia bacterium]|nr:SPOR domain-containing protein [Spirochaetia bacterium]MDD7699040.1 SPOR domain-containing protein [Spirochaetia bacterium]MDY4211164.1 SPOR domain-containing protein [Treponema sp.]